MIRVLHAITGLEVGGAELALMRLLSAVDRTRVVPEVVSLTPGGPVADQIRHLGVPVHEIGATGARQVLPALVRLRSLVRDGRFDVVQTWLHHADLVAGLAARGAGVPVVWGLRMGDLRAERRATRAVAWLNARLAGRVPTAIVACASSVASEYVDRGYPRERVVVIPNGYAVGSSSPTGGDLRAELHIPAEALVVGRIGRWHPMKDQAGFLDAAGPLLSEDRRLHLLLVGAGVDRDNHVLAALAAASPAPERVHLLGRRDDMPAVYASLDVLCSSSSSGEGFPNVLAEALLAGVSVVTTDVGDSAAIVGEVGWVVPPSQPASLRVALAAAVAEEPSARAERGRQGRRHVETHFGLAGMASAFTDLHERVASGGGAR